ASSETRHHVQAHLSQTDKPELHDVSGPAEAGHYGFGAVVSAFRRTAAAASPVPPPATADRARAGARAALGGRPRRATRNRRAPVRVPACRTKSLRRESVHPLVEWRSRARRLRYSVPPCAADPSNGGSAGRTRTSWLPSCGRERPFEIDAGRQPGEHPARRTREAPCNRPA